MVINGQVYFTIYEQLARTFPAFMLSSFQKRSIKITAETKSYMPGKQIRSEKNKTTITGTKNQYNRTNLLLIKYDH